MIEYNTSGKDESMNEKKGFTLIELLVVMVIATIIVLVAVEAVRSFNKNWSDDHVESSSEGWK
jgi:prepilin-type N-terminal cleavage/methylation domain-containing protein